MPKRITIPTEFLTIQEVAHALGLSERMVRAIVARGDLPHHRFGRCVRIKRTDLDEFTAQCRIATGNTEQRETD